MKQEIGLGQFATESKKENFQGLYAVGLCEKLWRKEKREEGKEGELKRLQTQIHTHTRPVKERRGEWWE